MASMSFQVNDASTDSINPVAVITITENADGSLSFQVTQTGPVIGDLRGLFFDINAIADGALAKSLKVSNSSAPATLIGGDDSVRDLGNGSNMNGLTSSNRDGGFDAGINIGTSGLGADDIRSFSFTLDSALRPLTLNDMANVDFGLRLTSVGTLGGSRAGSSKLLESTSAPIDVNNDADAVVENAVTNGNLLTNDSNKLGVTTVTGWSGGVLGTAVALSNFAGASLLVNADGTYVLSATNADALSANESFTFTFRYDGQSASADQVSNDSGTFTVTVTGVNDGPTAGNDSATAAENAAAATGNVMANDRDVDRLDTIGVTGWSGGALGNSVVLTNGAGATFKLNADGSYALDASAADALSSGETVSQDFIYTLTDNHGASTTASVRVNVTGVNDGPDAKDDSAGRILESGVASGSVLGNDTDVDRLDVLTVTTVNGKDVGTAVTLASGANVTMCCDGSYTYDANGAFNALSSGQSVTDSFSYTISDGNGGFDTATVSVIIDGVSPYAPPPPPLPPPPPIATDPSWVGKFPTMAQDISNVVLYLDDGNAATGILKVKLQPEGLSIKDVDDLKISDFINTQGSLLGNNTTLVGISIHAGQEYPNVADYDYTAQGEGAFYFLLDNDNPIVEAVGARNGSTGPWTSDWSKDDIPLTAEAQLIGLNYALLEQQAQVVFNHFQNGIWLA